MNDEILNNTETRKEEPFSIEKLMKRSDEFWSKDDDEPVLTNRFIK